MRLLALETSGMGGSVAALDGSALLCQTPLDSLLRSARSLAPAIHGVLKEVGWKPRQVELLAVTTGPGSFTGLRVGVATAKTFAYAAGCQVLGVNTLEALAEQAPGDGVVRAVIDAQRGELFSATFDRSPEGRQTGQLPAVPELQIVPIEAWLESLKPGEVVIGPVLGRLKHRLPEGVRIAPEDTWMPQAASVGRVAFRRYSAGERDDVWHLLPVYGRRSAAEEKAAG